MIDEPVPGASGTGKTTFAEIEKLDSLKGSRQVTGADLDMDAVQKAADADPTQATQDDSSEAFDPSKIVERWGDKVAVSDVLNLTKPVDNTPNKPGWRDEYQAQKPVAKTTSVPALKTTK